MKSTKETTVYTNHFLTAAIEFFQEIQSSPKRNRRILPGSVRAYQ
jgi:hypothetical protein